MSDNKTGIHYDASQESASEAKNVVPAKNRISRIYLGFRLRVTLLIIGILLLFTCASVMMITTLRSNETYKVRYNESTKVHYDVCSIHDDVKDCMIENREYSSNSTSLIRGQFQYQVLFEESIPYHLSYYITVVNKIYDPFDANKIYYEAEKILVDSTQIDNSNSNIIANIEIDYPKYNEFVAEYLDKYSVTAKSTVDAIIYIDDGMETRSVGRISIPLNEETYEIHTDSLSREQRTYTYAKGEWSNRNTLAIVLGSLLILASLFLLSYLTKLVLTITVKKSKYQQRLSSIMSDYNHYIVNSKEDYKIDSSKRIVKVSSFEELLDARSIINKPIIYSKINNIKSEFILEDTDIIYKYVLKEADMEE